MLEELHRGKNEFFFKKERKKKTEGGVKRKDRWKKVGLLGKARIKFLQLRS